MIYNFLKLIASIHQHMLRFGIPIPNELDESFLIFHTAYPLKLFSALPTADKRSFRSERGSGVWVVKSRAASPPQSVAEHQPRTALVSSVNSEPQLHPRHPGKYPPNICGKFLCVFGNAFPSQIIRWHRVCVFVYVSVCMSVSPIFSFDNH